MRVRCACSAGLVFLQLQGPREPDQGAEQVLVLEVVRAVGDVEPDQGPAVGPVRLLEVLVGGLEGPVAPGLLEGRRPAAGQQRQQQDGADGQQRRQRRPAAHPLHDALQPADRPGLDRLAAQEAAQVVGQRQGAGVALGRLLLQALQADRLQVARHARVARARAARARR